MGKRIKNKVRSAFQIDVHATIDVQKLANAALTAAVNLAKRVRDRSRQDVDVPKQLRDRKPAERP